MTIEEAIRILDPETTVEALEEIEYYAGFRGKEAMKKAFSDASILAVAALREQEQRRWIPMDAVEVVRCRDCKHLVLTAEREHNPCDCVCDYWMTDGLNDNDFCSYGERKDGDGDAWKEKDGG